jgi:DNA repair exonuclease SbcCD ATPase subunit
VPVGEIIRSVPPDEEELRKQLQVAVSLESELVERELQLATIKAELQTFETRYVESVGVLYAELDAVEVEIAAFLHRAAPCDSAVRDAYERAATRSTQSKQEAEGRRIHSIPAPVFEPTESLKKLYRDCAKVLHPDMSADGADTETRTRLMSELSDAYSNGDECRMRSILEEWNRGKSSPEASVAAKLLGILRRIVELRAAIHRTATEIANLNGSSLGKLMAKEASLRVLGRDMLGEMRQRIQATIAPRKDVLAKLMAGGP